ncbi:hypothetical protein ACF0H5_012960 [Mactra antiquata]
MMFEVLGGVVASCVTAYVGIKLLCPWLLIDFQYLKKILPALKMFNSFEKSRTILVNLFEENVRKNPDKVFILFEDEKYTYKEINERANKVGRVVMSLGVKPNDNVTLVHYNSPEFAWVYLGLLKIGARVSMININLRGKALSHSIEVSESKIILVENGLPKAAVVSQKKLMSAYMIGASASITSNDTIYVSLPLYHSSALVVGLGCTILTDSTIALARKFSKSNFFKDVRKYEATVILYIGELCRYLLTNEKSELDKQHKIRLAVGNGLRQDIFEEFQTRFGIQDIVEFYASTEGALGFINLFNMTGACGRSSPFLQKFLPCQFCKWDVENECLVRDKNGLCVPVKQGEPGLLLVQLNKMQVFDGYKGNKKMSTSKIVCDVRKKGDQYFNSGDLLSFDQSYFVYFNDRLGDTFRWKGENVSTTEISNLLTEISFIVDACVYGVSIPGCDGKAGMATLLMDSGCKQVTSEELKAIYDYCQQTLPVYAIPMFLRFKWGELDMTSTIKQSKVKLKQEGFDLNMIDDPLYFFDRSSKSYCSVTMETYSDIMSQKLNF